MHSDADKPLSPLGGPSLAYDHTVKGTALWGALQALLAHALKVAAGEKLPVPNWENFWKFSRSCGGLQCSWRPGEGAALKCKYSVPWQAPLLPAPSKQETTKHVEACARSCVVAAPLSGQAETLLVAACYSSPQEIAQKQPPQRRLLMASISKRTADECAPSKLK